MKRVLLILLSIIQLGNVLLTIPGEMFYERETYQEISAAGSEQQKATFSQYFYPYFLASSRSETAVDFSCSSFQLSAFEKSFRKYASLLRQIEPVMITNVFRYVLRNNCYHIHSNKFISLFPFHEFF